MKRAASGSMSNSFNPPLAQQRGKSPLPPIAPQQTNTMVNDETDLVLPTKVFQGKKKSVTDLSEALCSYLWFRRIKEIFLVMGKQNDAFTRFDMELARKEMIQTCDQYLESERPKKESEDQKKLDRWKNRRLYAETFRMSYFRKETNVDEKNTVKFPMMTQPTDLSYGEIPKFDNSIWWYSCNEAPIFDQMNNILRLENFELLMCHRYFISDLCQMIERAYTRDKFSQKKSLYRADKLSKQDFDILKESCKQKDARISINGFISTSHNEKVSLAYAKKKLEKRDNNVVVLYEITVDPTIPCTAYADIESISFHPEEEEVLFNMGSTFQIDDIIPDPTNGDIQRIQLTARDFHVALVDEMKAKVKQASQATLSILLVRYLIELGEDRVCKRYLNQVIESKQLDNDANLAAAYKCLGLIHSRQALYGEALECYRKALNTQARLEFSNNNALAEIFNLIGETHLGLEQLEEAKQNFEEGIRIQLREPKISQQHLASLYCNLGRVAYAKRDWDEAQEHYERAYDLYNRSTKISHDALEKQLEKANLCIAFGQLTSVRNRKNPDEAKEKFEEALGIYRRVLPSSHPKVVETHMDIVNGYIANKDCAAAIEYYEEHIKDLLNDYQNKPSSSQMDLANLYANLGACYAHSEEFDKAMEMWEKGFEHEQKAFLDELLSSVRAPKVSLHRRLVESAYQSVLKHYGSDPNAKKEYYALLYAKTCAYERAIELLRGQNSFLLAQMCIAGRNFRGSLVVYKRLSEPGTKFDQTRRIGLLVGMLKIKSKSVTDEPIEELSKIENDLRRKGNENEANRLRMIINDYLAEGYLGTKQFDKARVCSQISFELKQRYYSPNHPSLIRNYQLMASCSLDQNDLKNAVQYYEKAIEIQLENLPSNHPDIRANYFLLGDCYCRMDKSELATESYDRAERSGDGDNEDESQKDTDVKALLRMHSCLSDLSAKQEEYETASRHQQSKIDLLENILPPWIVTMIEEEDEDLWMNFDQLETVIEDRLGLLEGSKFGQVLQNIAFIRFAVGRALLECGANTSDDKDSTDVFQDAIELQLKLFLFDSSDENDLADRYEELANAYDRLYLREQENIRENLIKAFEASNREEQKRKFAFRIGNLYFDDENYLEANRYWRMALDELPDPSPMRPIIQKLIEKNQNNFSEFEQDSDDDDDDEDEEEAEEKKSESSRAPSAKSTHDKEKSDDGAEAEGYLDLGDDETALKLLKKCISKLEESAKPTYPDISVEEEKSSLVRSYYALISRNLKSKEIADEPIWTNLLKTYMKLYSAALRCGDEFESMSKAMLAVFYIAERFQLLPDGLVSLFQHLFKNDLDQLQWDSVIQCVSPIQARTIFIQLADYHCAESEHNSALSVYLQLQRDSSNDLMSMAMINYGILKLLKVYIAADADYCSAVENVDIHSSTIPIFDRILLCRLIVAFFEELEHEEEVNKYQKELVKLYREKWQILPLKQMNGIGSALMHYGNHQLAHFYWEDLYKIFTEVMPESFAHRLYSSESTFEHLYRSAQDINCDLTDYIVALASSYASMSEYDRKCGWDGESSQSLKKAIAIGKKMDRLKEKVQLWQKTLNN